MGLFLIEITCDRCLMVSVVDTEITCDRCLMVLVVDTEYREIGISLHNSVEEEIIQSDHNSVLDVMIPTYIIVIIPLILCQICWS